MRSAEFNYCNGMQTKARSKKW